jgi:hypothetical protein
MLCPVVVNYGKKALVLTLISKSRAIRERELCITVLLGHITS